MSAYWDNEITRIALPTIYTHQAPGESRAGWLRSIGDGLEKQITAAQEQLKRVRAMQAEYEGRICMECYGTGVLRVQISSDESTSILCNPCKGTGKPLGESDGNEKQSR